LKVINKLNEIIKLFFQIFYLDKSTFPMHAYTHYFADLKNYFVFFNFFRSINHLSRKLFASPKNLVKEITSGTSIIKSPITLARAVTEPNSKRVVVTAIATSK